MFILHRGKKNAGNMNEQVRRGQAPKSIDRVDTRNSDPKGHRMPHIHLTMVDMHYTMMEHGNMVEDH
jgi:hypothetical protein